MVGDGLRVVIAEDGLIVREGVAVMLRRFGHEVVAAVGDAVALKEAVARLAWWRGWHGGAAGAARVCGRQGERRRPAWPGGRSGEAVGEGVVGDGAEMVGYEAGFAVAAFVGSAVGDGVGQGA